MLAFEAKGNAMPDQEQAEGPYRSKLPVLAPRGEDLRWRARASRGAIVLLWALGFEVVLPDELARPFLLLGLWATWLLTTPKQGEETRARRMGTALRVLACVDAALMLAGSFVRSDVIQIVRSLIHPALPVVGMLFVSSRLVLAHLDHRARQARRSALLLLSGFVLSFTPQILALLPVGDLYPYLVVPAAALGLCWLLGYTQAFFLTLQLRGALKVVHHEWWLDYSALPQIRWVSYARMATGAVELLLADGDSRGFDSDRNALHWAFGSGLVPAEHALAQKLVKRSPSAA